MYYTTDRILTAIDANTMYPTSSQTESESDILDMLNEELQLNVVPVMHSVREDFFLRTTQFDVVANVSKYPVPSRALGNALKHVFYIDNSGTRTQMFRMTITDLANTQVTTGYNSNQFYVMGDEIVLFPTPPGGGTLEMWYYERPNQLVKTADVAKITALSSVGGTTTFTVDTDLTATLAVGDNVDFLNAQSPFLLWAQSVPVTAITTTTIAVLTVDITNEAGLLELPGIDDFICLEGQANIPMIPEEFHPILVQAVNMRIMMTIKDDKGYAMAKAKMDTQLSYLRQMIGNRIEDQVQTLRDSYGIGSYQSGLSVYQTPWGW